MRRWSWGWRVDGGNATLALITRMVLPVHTDTGTVWCCVYDQREAGGASAALNVRVVVVISSAEVRYAGGLWWAGLQWAGLQWAGAELGSALQNTRLPRQRWRGWCQLVIT